MERMKEAQKAVASTLRKNEKALATLSEKGAKPWLIGQTALAVRCHRTLLALLEGHEAPAADIREALDAVPAYVSRIEAILPKFAPGTSQHTLAIRRLEAYALAAELGKNHLKEESSC